MVGALPQRADQAELVQRRWSQIVDKTTYVGNRGARVGAQGGEELVRSGRIDRDKVGGRVGGERDAGQRRAEAVVEVAAEPAAFLFARGDELLA